MAEPVVTPWQSLNSRLDAPGGVQVTLFQELLESGERAVLDGFSTDAERGDDDRDDGATRGEDGATRGD